MASFSALPAFVFSVFDPWLLTLRQDIRFKAA
jgi:hypothetical protein